MLSDVQQSNYPISYNEMNLTLNNYMATLYGKTSDEYLNERDKYLENREVKVAENITTKERWQAREYLPTHTNAILLDHP